MKLKLAWYFHFWKGPAPLKVLFSPIKSIFWEAFLYELSLKHSLKWCETLDSHKYFIHTLKKSCPRLENPLIIDMVFCSLIGSSTLTKWSITLNTMKRPYYMDNFILFFCQKEITNGDLIIQNIISSTILFYIFAWRKLQTGTT